MTDLLQTGAQWLADQQAEQCAHAVTYTRAGVSATVQALVGASEWELPDAGGPALMVTTRDYIIRVADLRLSGAAITPARGDRITESVGGSTEIFEVMAPEGEQHYRHTDQYGYAYRIHTTQVDTS